MFIHLGGDVIVAKSDVIAIIDIKNAEEADATKEFLQVADDEGFIRSISEKGKEKSFVITSKHVYISPISSMTLFKRAEHIKTMINEWDSVTQD